MVQRVREIAAAAAIAVLTLLASPAHADTLYPAGPQAVPARPLDLFGDHRAHAVGDLLTVVFNFAVSNNATVTNSAKKDFSANGGPGSGLLGIWPLNLTTSLSGASSADNSQVRSGQQSLNAVMEATVVNVLPNGNLQIVGHQGVQVNGQPQVLKITGVVRPEDIDSTNTIPSSLVANVSATFVGQLQRSRPGLINRLLHLLF